MTNRYQIITYSRDSGADEKQETNTLKAAHQLVYAYMTEGIINTGRSYYESAAIYDHKLRRIAAVYNDFNQDSIISPANRNYNAPRYYIAQPN